jgi:hypothetical protein
LCKPNLSKSEFLDKLDESLCTEWYKDYDNEFWSSSDPDIKDNAWNLTGEKCKNEFIELRNYYNDEIIFFAINICCNSYNSCFFHNIESIKKTCKMTFDKIKRI